jgi:hypothetical protein
LPYRCPAFDPIVIGLAIGLVAFAAPARRGNLERASKLFRRFREQPQRRSRPGQRESG